MAAIFRLIKRGTWEKVRKNDLTTEAQRTLRDKLTISFLCVLCVSVVRLRLGRDSVS
jgi:hypothetical protein